MLVERAVVVSPLLNLAPASGSGAALKQTCTLLPLRGSPLRGTSTLSLTPDRRTLDISLSLDPPRHVTIALRWVGSAQGSSWDRFEEDVLIVEIAACERALAGACGPTRFSLDARPEYESFAHPDDLAEAGIDLSGLRAASIDGIHVEPAQACRRAGPSPADYFTQRMLTEIDAAQASATAVAAARHVELAILYARRVDRAHPGPR